mgnify:CR=1 FL=1
MSKSKNDIFYLIVLVLTMITMIIGITFTYFSFIAKEKDDSTKVQTGSIAINYIDGIAINSNGLIPRKEPLLEESYAVYKKRFAVSSSGTLDQTLDIYIKVIKNEFLNNNLKFALYNSNGSKISSGSIPTRDKDKVLLISGDILKTNSTNSYTVVMWLNDDGTNQNYEMSNSFVGGFSIDAQQLKYQ